MEPIQGYLLSYDSEGKFFTDLESVSWSLNLLEVFCDSMLQSEYSPSESVDVHQYEIFDSELKKPYNACKKCEWCGITFSFE